MRKIKRLLALGAAALMLVSSMSVPVFADNPNIRDEPWGFTIGPGSVYHITGAREKRDASSTYVHYETGTKPSLGVDVLNEAGKSQCKKTGTIKLGQKGLMYQFVYENGFEKCKLKLFTNNNADGGANGKWSPDSIGTYTVINK